MQISNSTWQGLFLSFIALSLLLTLIFRLLRYILPLINHNKTFLERMHKTLPVVEVISWFVFLSWFVFRFAEIMQVYALIILTILFFLLFWISRYLLKEVIAGVIFRSTGNYKIGDQLVLEEQGGTIRRFKLNLVEIENSEGEIVCIPYSYLAGHITIKRERDEQTSAYTFVLETSINSTAEKIAGDIKSFILSLPWSSVRKMPVVLLLEENETRFLFEITVYPVEKSMAKKIELEVRKKFALS